MAIDPRTRHTLEQFAALLTEISSHLAVYRQSLVEQGFTDDEAMDMVFRLEERLLGPLMDEMEALTQEEGSE